MGDALILYAEIESFTSYDSTAGAIAPMAIQKKILEWQASHPNITWLGWGRRLGDRSCNPVSASEEGAGSSNLMGAYCQLISIKYKRQASD
jgi:hypothetical protein